MTEKRYSVWTNETEAREEGPEYETWQGAKRELDVLKLSIIQRNWRIWRHDDDGSVTDVTTEESADER